MKKRARLALPMLLALTAATQAQAPAPPAPVPFARVSIASTDALEKLAADFGMPIPDPLKKTNIESKTFIGPGTIATDRPLGVVVVANDAQPPLALFVNSYIMGVPIVEGKVTPETITGMGGKPVEGQPDTFTVTNTLVRKVGGYLFYQPAGGAGIQDLKDSVFTNDYKQPGNVVVASLDLAALRRSPKVYGALFGGLPGVPIPAEAMATLHSAADKLDRVTLALFRDDSSVHLRTWLTSEALFASKPAKQAPRPAFPAGTLMQIHAVYPDAETAAWPERAIDTLPAGSFKPFTADQETKARVLVKRVVKLLVEGDAVSLGVGLKNGKPVIYLVNQVSQDVDFAGEAKDISDAGAALAKEAGITADQSVAPYDANGRSVTRWTIGDGAQKTYIDCLQVGKQLFITLSPDDGKYVDEFAALPPAGTSGVLCAGVIDLGAIAKNIPDGALPPEMMQTIKDATTGQAITWTAQLAEQGNYLYVDLRVPNQVLKGGPKIAQGVMGMFMGGMSGPGGMPPGGGMMTPGSMPAGMMPTMPGTMPATGPGAN